MVALCWKTNQHRWLMNGLNVEAIYSMIREICINPCLVNYYCNISNFWRDTYGHMPHCLWCCFDVLFCILGIRPHCTWEWWFVWYIGHKPVSYVLCIWFYVSGVDRETNNWWDGCVECKLWSTWVFDVFC